MLFVNIGDLHRKVYLKVEGEDEHESIFIMKSFDKFIDLLKRADNATATSTYKEIPELENFLNSAEKNEYHITKSLESDNSPGLFCESMITDLTGEITFLRGQINKSDTYLRVHIRGLKMLVFRKILRTYKCMTSYSNDNFAPREEKIITNNNKRLISTVNVRYSCRD